LALRHTYDDLGCLQDDSVIDESMMNMTTLGDAPSSSTPAVKTPKPRKGRGKRADKVLLDVCSV